MMTLQLTVADGETSLEKPADVSPGVALDLLRAYVANPIYRSARFEELVIDDNPYRRPVRPEDFEWLGFDQPLTRDSSSQLSSLLGNRVLLNVYDSGRPLLPAQMTAEKWRDFDLFYSLENRARGEAVRPFLEHHLFDYVYQERQSQDLDARIDGPAAAVDLLHDVADERRRQAALLVSTIVSSPQPARAATMLTIQLLGGELSAPQPMTRGTVRRLLDATNRPQRPSTEVAAASPVTPARQLLADLAHQFELGQQPHQYYQFYLPSTLALMNYVIGAQRDPGRVFRLLGALVARAIESAAFLGSESQDLAASLRGCDSGSASLALPLDGQDPVRQTVHWLSEHVVATISDRCGPRGLREFSYGVAEYATLLGVHHDDLLTQLRWIDASEACRQKAERLQSAITRHQIPVELDTFVESWEECSTTHVHDADRLLIIESGEMNFWNCFGDIHRLKPGDKFFVPKHRLHGSVVQSGQCVYHQPVITPEINQRYG